MVYKAFIAFSGYLSTRETRDKGIIDDFAFRLHYTFTTALLFLSSALISMSDLVGKNIRCHLNRKPKSLDDVKNYVKWAEQYCWITGTYVTPDQFGMNRLEDIDVDGMKCSWRNESNVWVTEHEELCKEHISYYQWIPYVLIIQGCALYIPRIIWLVLEEGKIFAMVKGVKRGSIIKKNESEKNSYLDTVANNVVDYLMMPQGGHYRYGMGYMFSQTMLLVFDLGSIAFTNKVLNNKFYRLGYDYVMADSLPGFGGTVISTDDKFSRYETLSRLFPLRGTCDVNWFGKGGDRELWQFFCVLGPNVLSRYIFLLLWFWYGILLIFSIGTIAKDTLIIFKSGNLRASFLVRAVGSTKLIHELWKEDGALFRVITNMNFGQFLFLYYFARNTPCVVSVVVLEKLREKTCIRENENQTRKIHSSTLPSYKSSWDNLEANAPTDSMTEEYKGPKTHRQSSSRQDLRKSRSLNQRPIYGSKNSDIHDDMEISSHPIIDQPDRSSSTLRARQISLPDPPEEFETYPNEYFQHVDHIHDDN